MYRIVLTKSLYPMERTDTVHPGNDEKWMEKEDALEQLYQLVGLRNVKEEITRVNRVGRICKNETKRTDLMMNFLQCICCLWAIRERGRVR